MLKKKGLLFGILIILFTAGIYLDQLLPVVTGYAAKNMASGIFVAGRSQESLENIDLNFSVLKYVKNTIDYEKKEVTSRFLWNKSKAIYIEGFGCTLVEDFQEEDIKNRPYQLIPSLPENPDTIAWPAGIKITDTIPQGIDMGKLEQAVSQIMADTIPYKGTFALMVIYKGFPVAEVYKEGFSADTKFLSWSMAKSFTNALVGIRVKQEKININNPIGLNIWQTDERRNITLNNLLHMNSGLDWNEQYGSLSDVTIMLHKVGDMGKYAAEKRYAYPADSTWLYSSGSPNLISLILRNSFQSDAEYYKFPREALFNKIGMRSAVFEVDASGTFVGSSYLYATMRDYGRFALLYENDGNWLGEQILPKGWVDYTRKPANGSEGNYGALFWLNLSDDQPDAPEDTYMCKGHDGQFIFIIPSKELIVIRTGFSKNGDFESNTMLKEILSCLE